MFTLQVRVHPELPDLFGGQTFGGAELNYFIAAATWLYAGFGEPAAVRSPNQSWILPGFVPSSCQLYM